MIIKKAALRALLLAAAVTTGAGCYTTRIHAGPPGVMPAPLATGRWHHTLVGGLAEIADPIDLEALCPQGWATINEEYSFLNGLAASVTSQIYTPRTYTVTCSGGAAVPGTAGPGWGAPPAGAPPGGTWGTPPAGAPQK
jgi:hypothetical protein